MLSRVVLPQRAFAAAATSTAMISSRRPFSTSLPNFKDDAPPKRHNPLVGNYQPAKPVVTRTQPPVSTEHPRATQTPSPSRAPASSAEVPPNADMPPPPPPPAAAAATATPGQTTTITPPTSTSEGASPTRRYDANSNYVDIAKILGNSAAAYAQSVDLIPDPQRLPRVHTRPIAGRTIFMEGNSPGSLISKSGQGAHNPQHAFQMLDRLLREQKVKSLHYKQRFYERKGMMRKRLRMERWRVRFKKGFKAAASRVLELKKQGW